jgi:hypothetical protein
MQRPTQNVITQGKHGSFNAVDFGASPDPIIYAPEDGKVSAKFVDPTCGNSLQVDGATGRSGFCHAESYYVNVGDTVKRGQPLGKMGYTGLTDPDNVPAGTHLHWVLNINNAYVYPIDKVNESFIKVSGEDDMWTDDMLNALWQVGTDSDKTDPEGAQFIKNYTGKTGIEPILAVQKSARNRKLLSDAAEYLKVKPVLDDALNWKSYAENTLLPKIADLEKGATGETAKKLAQLQTDIQASLDKSKE